MLVLSRAAVFSAAVLAIVSGSVSSASAQPSRAPADTSAASVRIAAPFPIVESKRFRVAFHFPQSSVVPTTVLGDLKVDLSAPDFSKYLTGGGKDLVGTFDPDGDLLPPNVTAPVGSYSLVTPAGFNNDLSGGVSFTIFLDSQAGEGQSRTLTVSKGAFRTDGSFSGRATFTDPFRGTAGTSAGTVTGIPTTSVAGPVVARVAGVTAYAGNITVTNTQAKNQTLPIQWELAHNPTTGEIVGTAKLTSGTYSGENRFDVTGKLSGQTVSLQLRAEVPLVPAGQVGRHILDVTAQFNTDGTTFTGTVRGVSGDNGRVTANTQNHRP